MKLTPKQELFCNEYLIDLNATQACIRAGYSVKTANRIGPELLVKTCIQEYIQKRMKAREKRTEINQDKVLQELANIAFSNGSDFAKVVIKKGKRPLTEEIEGKKVVTGYEEFEYQTVELENTDSISNEKRSAIAGIKETKFGISVESCDKVKALELLGKHLGIFVDKVESTNTNLNLNKDVDNMTIEEVEAELKKYE